jgi:hypothetical protein
VKKHFLSGILLLATTICFGQEKFKIKKGKIYNGDTHIASYDGKGGLLRLFNITVSGTDDKPLITMQEAIYDFDIPWEIHRRWMTLEFPGVPGKKMKLRVDPAERTENRIMKLLLNDSLPFLIKENKIDESALDQWMTQKNYDFNADSLYTRKMQNEIIDAMKENLVRDKAQPLQVIKVSENQADPYSATITKFDIKQGGVTLGRIVKTRNVSAMAMRPSLKYEIWKNVAKPYTVGNGKESLSVAMLAKYEYDKGTYLVPAGKMVEVKLPTPDASEYTLADWLVKSGHL